MKDRKLPEPNELTHQRPGQAICKRSFSVMKLQIAISIKLLISYFFSVFFSPKGTLGSDSECLRD